MVLGIDIGNTNIVLGGFSGRRIEFEARMATDVLKTSDQYCAELKSMLGLFDVRVQDVEDVIISSVVPPVLNSFKTAIRKLTGLECMLVGPGLKTGLDIRIDNPRQAGSDLIVAAVAAIREYGAPLLIVDMGTATTISAISADGAYLGGCICPGVRISLDALISRTAQLPGISLGEPQRAIGHNTVDCMQSGVMIGAAAMLDGMVERMEEELGAPVKVIVTGGISRFILPYCRREMIYDKDLLLKGLITLYHNNARQTPKAYKNHINKNPVSPTMLQTPMAAVTMVSSQASSPLRLRRGGAAAVCGQGRGMILAVCFIIINNVLSLGGGAGGQRSPAGSAAWDLFLVLL